MYKKHTFEDRVKYMNILDEGYSQNYIHKRYGISTELLSLLYRKYKESGIEGLRKAKYLVSFMHHGVKKDSESRMLNQACLTTLRFYLILCKSIWVGFLCLLNSQCLFWFLYL